MKKDIDLLAHLKVSGEAIKDWPAWKRDIWPAVTTLSSTPSLSERSLLVNGNFLPHFQAIHRTK
ncbi:hypothetical protein ACWYXN_16170 [Janthinobacterium aestuarii]